MGTPALFTQRSSLPQSFPLLSLLGFLFVQLFQANRKYIQSLSQMARLAESLQSDGLLDLSDPSSSESDWEGDFYRPSHLFHSLQPPEGRLATTLRIPGCKGGRYSGGSVRTKERKQLDLKRLTKGTFARDGTQLAPPVAKVKPMEHFFKPAETPAEGPREASSPCTPLDVESLEAAQKYEKKCRACFDKETTPSQAKLLLSQLTRVQAIVRYIDKYLQMKEGKPANMSEIQLRTEAAKQSGAKTYRVKGDKGVQ